MEDTVVHPDELMRAKLKMPVYVGASQLLDITTHINDTITAMDGLYTQLALIVAGDVREACEYEAIARSYLRRHHHGVVDVILRKQTRKSRHITSFDHYPFVSQMNPLLDFNRRLLGKYPVSVKSLALSSISMGSINLDLLGLGKILDFIEHAVKQIRWQARYEKEMAFQSRHMASLEEQLLGQKIIEARLANEEKKLYIASKKVELFALIRKLDLPLKEKQKLVKSIVEKVDLIDLMADVKIIKGQLSSTRGAKNRKT
jgi:hypothetical protein